MRSDTFREKKSILTEENVILRGDFAENCLNDQQDSTQSEYFGNQSLSIFTAFLYTKPVGFNDMQNDSDIMVT